MRGWVLRHARSIGAKGCGRNFATGWAVRPSSASKLLKGLVGASGFEPPTSWSRTINPRTIKDLAAAQQFCVGLRYVASLQRLGGIPRDGTGNLGQRFYAWGGHKNGHSFPAHSPVHMILGTNTPKPSGASKQTELNSAPCRADVQRGTIAV
jgi:hypothetical protein